MQPTLKKRKVCAVHPWPNLPLELFWHILQELCLHEWLRLREVSRAFHKLVCHPHCASLRVDYSALRLCRAVGLIANWTATKRVLLMHLHDLRCLDALVHLPNLQRLEVRGGNRAVPPPCNTHCAAEEGRLPALPKLRVFVVRDYEHRPFNFDPWSTLCLNVQHLELYHVIGSAPTETAAWSKLSSITSKKVRLDEKHILSADTLSAREWIILGDSWGDMWMQMAITNHKPNCIIFTDFDEKDEKSRRALEARGDRAIMFKECDDLKKSLPVLMVSI
eukprot:TRINITY_DN199_c0_g1_i1.p1 TRINITY_DN199_c0_g1~~TRINITY_DN199_c0_g1_i1.p1  ORF type:complete len:277 (+),score=-19.98 TRINITY_DN199_c0_g1_i1:369-1199(+)